MRTFLRDSQNSEIDTFTTVFIKNLPTTINNPEDLAALVRPFGPLFALHLECPEGQRKYGVCTFSDHFAAVRAVSRLDGLVVQGSLLICERFKHSAERAKEAQELGLCVRGFGPEFGEDEIVAFFAPFGDVERVILPSGDDEQQRRFAIVVFSDRENEEHCIAKSLFMRFPDTGWQTFVQRRGLLETDTTTGQGQGQGPWMSLFQQISEQRSGVAKEHWLRNVSRLSDDQAMCLLRDRNLLVRWMEWM